MSKRGFGWDSNPWVWVVDFRKEGMSDKAYKTLCPAAGQHRKGKGS